MKRFALILAACGWMLPGCISSDIFPNASQLADETETMKAKYNNRPPPVMPEQVNDGNAHAMALALDAEMDFDARQAVAGGK